MKTWAWLFLLFIQADVFAAETLTVAVATNVKYAFDDLAAAFTKETGIEVRPVFSQASHAEAARKFYGFPYSQQACAIFEKYGYALP